eukprot:gnl/MRDRNA2_/MRDRNA2_27488_c0_seq1.p1 gnl/MRDRNA2_/MRDRNA2_27488_c0~~gnl/MRDRNA2_/MRDRNA2_27488_c0_seq1.p1  ORF type:complete len:602 (+),score=100.02 gnl/MRDRNA2_/MRDRNA2_27488_c0_seq1:1-1806(+)
MFRYRWCICPETSSRQKKGFLASDFMCFECYSGNELISRRTRLLSTSFVSAYAIGVLACLPVIVACVHRCCPRILMPVITVAGYGGSVGFLAFAFALFCAVGWGVFSSFCVLGHAMEEKTLIEIKSYPDYFYADLCMYGNLEQQLIGFLVCGMILNAVTLAMLQLLKVQRRAELKQQREDEIIKGVQPLAKAAALIDTFDSRVPVSAKPLFPLFGSKSAGGLSSHCRVRRSGLQKPDKPDLEDGEILDDEIPACVDGTSTWPRRELHSTDAKDELSVATAEDLDDLFVSRKGFEGISSRHPVAPEPCHQPLGSQEQTADEQQDVFDDFWTKEEKPSTRRGAEGPAERLDAHDIQGLITGPHGPSSQNVAKSKQKSSPAPILQRPEPIAEPDDATPAPPPDAGFPSLLPSQPTNEMMQQLTAHGLTSSPQKEMVSEVSVSSVDAPYVLPACPAKKSSKPCRNAISQEDASVCSVEEPPCLPKPPDTPEIHATTALGTNIQALHTVSSNPWWRELHTRDGRTYWEHIQTGKISWDAPHAVAQKPPSPTGTNHEKPQKQDKPPQVGATKRSYGGPDDDPRWETLRTKDGRSYRRHIVTGQIQWD